jgi:hypothetical protein
VSSQLPATELFGLATRARSRHTAGFVTFGDPSQQIGDGVGVEEDHGVDGASESMWAEPEPVYDGTLFGAEQLNPEEVERLLANRPSRLIVWLGEPGSGKTTLAIELYERQRRGIRGVRFAGSWTLLALEQLAEHRRRTGETTPAQRADLDPEGREVLHLALSTGDTPLHLLMADLPGEVFRRLADNQLSVESIEWLGRADKLVLLVDGACLRDVAQRSRSVTRVRQLIERLASAGVLGPDKRLALLVTKWDLVADDGVATRYWEQRESELLQDIREFDGSAVALRAQAPAGAGSDGVAELRDWLLEVGAAGAAGAIHDEPGVHFPLNDAPAVPVSVEAFEHFSWPALEPARSRRWWRRQR